MQIMQLFATTPMVNGLIEMQSVLLKITSSVEVEMHIMNGEMFGSSHKLLSPSSA